MRFNPSSKPNENLLPDGLFAFEVKDAVEKTSRANNDMMVLKLRVGPDDKPALITDYIVSTNIRKVRSVAKACGLLELFDTGEILPENFIGCRGLLKLEVERSTNPNYPDRNVVTRYIAKRSQG
jgi:hypothetical protein